MGAMTHEFKIKKSAPWLLTVALVVVFVVTWWSLETPFVPKHLRGHRPSAELTFEEQRAHSLRALLRTLYLQDIAVDSQTFRDYAGTEWNLSTPATWRKPLRKRMCIIDVDTRQLNQTHEILDKDPLNWDTTNPLTAGMLNHYMYAMIHGYDYHFVKTEKLKDRAVYWSKPGALSRVLKDYDVCVMIDADAIFTHLALPFEWLLNRWGYGKGKASLAMALDPEKSWNKDGKNRTMGNAGFVVAQNLERTHDILNAWATCPDDEVRFPNCSHWKQPWPAEQAAFANYIRYEYDWPNDVLEIPCTEGNGYPEAKQGCDGQFVRHYWLKKGELLRGGVAASLAQAVVGKAHDSLLKNKEEVVVHDSPKNGLRVGSL